MSIINKVRIGFGLPVLIMAGIGTLAYQMSSEVAKTSRSVEHTFEIVGELRGLAAKIQDLVKVQQGFLASNREYREPKELMDAVHKHIQNLRRLTADNAEQQSRLTEFESAITGWNAFVKRGTELRDKQGMPAATAWFRSGEAQTLSERARKAHRDIEADENALLTQRSMSAAASARRSMAVIGYGTVAAVLFAFLVSIFLERMISGPVRRLVDAAHIFGQGDLAYRVLPEKDELGVLATALNEMGSKLETSQERLHEQSSRLQLVLTSMSDGVVACDKKGRFVLFNPAAERILGVGPTEGDTQDWTTKYGVYLLDAMSPCPPSELPLARAMRGEIVDNLEMLVRNDAKPDGVCLTMSARPLVSQDGVAQGGVVVLRDTTERRRSDLKIRQLNSDLRERALALEAVNSELEAFSYSVSHDLRAPLRHINGYAALLVKHAGASLDEKSTRYLEMISGSAREMGQLIDDLLAFARMGRSEMHSRLVPLDQLANEVIQSLESESRGRDVDWKIGSLPAVNADPNMMRLVLVNLVSNALKYTRTKTHAEIEIGCGVEKENAESSRAGTEKKVIVCVKDNGVGFDMRYSDKLFGVFQRLHSASEFEGTGIGLANVRRIIHRHGGETWAEGVMNEGASFYFSLPSGVKAA